VRVPQKSIPARNDDNARGSEANDGSDIAALKVRGLALRLVGESATKIHSRT